MKQILIITNGHLSRNPRVVKEAETLGNAGFDTTVLTVRNHAPSEPFDAGLLRGAPYRHEAIDMLPGQSRDPVSAHYRLFLDRFARKISRWHPTIHALGPATSLLHRARAIPADLTIVHNEIAHWTGCRLADEGRLVAADIEDWHSEDLPAGDRALRPLAAIRKVESGLMHKCVHTTTTSRAMAEALHLRYGGKKPHVITNSFPLQPPTARENPARPPSFFWFSQTIGPGRGLEFFIDVFVRMKNPGRLVLLGKPQPGYLEHLLAPLSAERRDTVAVHPLVAPDDLPAVIAEHDIGLALEETEIPSRNLTITNKILQYLNAGLAVVATDTAGQREVLAQSPDAGILISRSGAEEAASILDQITGDPRELARRQIAARRLAEERYNWEHEARNLLPLVNRSLNPHD